MATPISDSGPNSGANSNPNAAQVQAQAQPSAAPACVTPSQLQVHIGWHHSPQRRLHDNNRGIFLEFDKFDLFENWLETPNLDLELTALCSCLYAHIGYRPVYQASVADAMTEEQRRRFPLVAQHIDIALVQRTLARFGNEMMGIVNELQQEMMDTMTVDKEEM